MQSFCMKKPFNSGARYVVRVSKQFLEDEGIGGFFEPCAFSVCTDVHIRHNNVLCHIDIVS